MNYIKKKVDNNKIAQQALKEAEARKNKSKKTTKIPKEIGGPTQLEPTRYGDWERKGITSDFWLLYYFLKFLNLSVNKKLHGLNARFFYANG